MLQSLDAMTASASKQALDVLSIRNKRIAIGANKRFRMADHSKAVLSRICAFAIRAFATVQPAKSVWRASK
jgi:hypothetical protein